MITYDLPDSFEQLVAFGQRPDVKIRPVLLRVLVDMFVSKSNHSPSDLIQFEEMMLHLLDDADDETRLVVAEKLSLDPNTPTALLDRFLAERGEIAAKVIALAPLDGRCLNAAAVFGTAVMAEAVANRPDLDGTAVRSLAERPESAVLVALARNKAASIDRSLFRHLARRAKTMPDLGAVLLERGDPTGEPTTTLFFAADRHRRAELIAMARRQDLGNLGRPAPLSPSPEALAAIERLSTRPGVEGLDGALAAALGLPQAEAMRLIDDRHGEPLALAFAALGISPEVAARLFILGDPAVGHSFSKVRALVGIVETVSAHAAHKLLMAMLGRISEAPRRPAPRPETAEATGRRVEPAAVRAAPAAAKPSIKQGARGR